MTENYDDALRPLLEGCRGAVQEEIDAVRADLERRGLADPVLATGGTRVPGSGATRTYDWTLPSGSFKIRVDDAVSIETESGSCLGFVVRFDATSNELRLVTDTALGERPGARLLTFDPTWMLEALDNRLAQIGTNPEQFHTGTALKLFGRQFPRVGERCPPAIHTSGLNQSQSTALARVLGSDVQFVWGPPGTGKTRVLGHAGAALADEGRVLIVAATNAAVDEAAARVAERLGPGAVEANRILRFGAGVSSGSDPVLGINAAVTRAERLRPTSLSRTIGELSVRLGLKDGDDESLAITATRVQAAARRTGDPADAALASRVAAGYQASIRRVVEMADVVLATFARLAIRDELASLRFDSVLIDEASAATLPYALYASCLASERVAVFGDFQQLPAVVQSRGELAAEWLRRDIFRASGVLDSEGGLPSPRDQLCSMLDQQYRMRPSIRALIGDLFYGGRLRDGLPAVDETGRDMILVDTASLEPRVDRLERSRRNDQHLEVLLRVLELLGRQGIHDVGVVAPYRIQVRELRKLVRSRLGRAAPLELEIATIHRFQGREKGVIIFDTVDAPPDRSWFLDERRNPDFPRMLNVALSRSRDLLILVATVEGLRRTLPEEALLNRVVERLRRDGVVVSGGSVKELRLALDNR